ncbi:MAG: Flp pilus assembly protein CpaB [Pseudomonadota bacterium]
MTVVGLGIAGGAVYFAQNQLNQVPVAQETQAELVRVVVASRDINFGAPIQNHMVTTIEWPVGSVPAGAISSRDEVIPTGGRLPRRAKRAIAQGELVLASKLSDWGEKVTITQTLGANNRATTIKVNASTGVGGFVTPGDEVDIVLTRGSGSDMRALTILQKIRVIGVDQRSDELNEEAAVARTVTVEVTPEQSQKLALAQRAGTLSLTLRSIDTEDDEPLKAVRLSDLLLEESPVADGQPKPVVRVRRGATDVTEQTLNK